MKFKFLAVLFAWIMTFSMIEAKAVDLRDQVVSVDPSMAEVSVAIHSFDFQIEDQFTYIDIGDSHRLESQITKNEYPPVRHRSYLKVLKVPWRIDNLNYDTGHAGKTNRTVLGHYKQFIGPGDNVAIVRQVDLSLACN